ncbi:MAG: hypothetical protein AAFR16_11420, partial [Pseudomonadota bacterium]
MTAEKITLNAEIDGSDGRALDPQAHDASAARGIATDLCTALTEAYAKHENVRPETLAVAVQTVLETLLSGIALGTRSPSTWILTRASPFTRMLLASATRMLAEFTPSRSMPESSVSSTVCTATASVSG